MLKQYKSYFQTVGTLPAKAQEEYLAVIHAQIEGEVNQMAHLDAKMKKSLIAIRTKAADNAIKIAPYMEKNEAIFQDTGVQTDFLKTQLESKALKERNRMVETYNVDATQADLWYQNQLNDIAAGGFSKRLETQRAFFDEYGIAAEGYYDKELETLKFQRDRLKGVMAPDELNALYDQWVKALRSRLQEPSMTTYQEMYDEIGIMEDAYYEHSAAKINQWYEIQKKIVGDTAALHETVNAKLMKNEAERLRHSRETSGETWAGFRAAQLELELEAKTHADVVADVYKDLANDMDRSFKTLFFDVMEMRFDNFTDIAIGALEAIRDAANEILYDILKNSIKQSMTGTGIGDLLGLAVSGASSLFGSSATSGATGATSVAQSQAITGGQSGVGGLRFDTGGWITEPVIGVGVNSGRDYQIAENGPELVINPRRGQTVGGGNSYAISVPVNVQGASNAQAGKLQAMIEDTVRDFVREELS
jgi:hypothetical protein